MVKIKKIITKTFGLVNNKVAYYKTLLSFIKFTLFQEIYQNLIVFSSFNSVRKILSLPSPKDLACSKLGSNTFFSFKLYIFSTHSTYLELSKMKL